MGRLKPLLTTLAVTGALVGGGAAIANAASTTSTTSSTSTTGTAPSTSTTGRSTAPAPPPGAHPGSGAKHNCPGM